MISNNKQKGFTLIELLVVIAIIGLLSSVVTVWMQDARKKAGAVSAQEQSRQIMNSLEISSINQSGSKSYPNSNPANYRAEGVDEIEENLAGNIVPKVPGSINSDGIYYYISTDNKTVDAEGVNYYCITEGDSISGGGTIPFSGPSQGSLIIAWRDTSMTKYPSEDPSKKKLFVPSADSFRPSGDPFIEAFESDAGTYYPGYGTVGTIGDESKTKLLWSKSGTETYPIACDVLK